ncbi:MAG: hypothetical protein DSZ05_00670 [Sulfurospirillum sp.]|nr:MAG: hypothetical protein DSZ05_00670 [Sulfurospirillum sp.]
MQIILGLFFLIIAATLIASKVEAISHEKKIQILKIAALVFALLWLYEASVDHSDKRIRNLYNAFRQGKTILCQDQKVTQAHFYFETGTESFVSTEESGPLSGLIYPASSCEVAGE